MLHGKNGQQGNIHQQGRPERAAPPLDRPLAVDDWTKSVSPYPFEAG